MSGDMAVGALMNAGEGEPFERITGFPLPSYVTVSRTYRLGR